MKVLFAIRHQTLPPTANYERPARALSETGSPFRVLARAEPWHQRRNGVAGNSHEGRTTTIPRRATINAFGFGGINAHVLIEEFLPAGVLALAGISLRQESIRSSPPRIAITGLAFHTSNSKNLAEYRNQLVTGKCVSSSNPDALAGDKLIAVFGKSFGVGCVERESNEGDPGRT